MWKVPLDISSRLNAAHYIVIIKVRSAMRGDWVQKNLQTEIFRRSLADSQSCSLGRGQERGPTSQSA